MNMQVGFRTLYRYSPFSRLNVPLKIKSSYALISVEVFVISLRIAENLGN